LGLHEHRLGDAAAVANHGERDLAGGPQMGDPAVDRDWLTDLPTEIGEPGIADGHFVICGG
jgi:hypothetical protein